MDTFSYDCLLIHVFTAVCDPPCQNLGICISPDYCQCPDNWDGPTCDQPRSGQKKCSLKPPTPLNSRIFCGKE